MTTTPRVRASAQNAHASNALLVGLCLLYCWSPPLQAKQPDLGTAAAAKAAAGRELLRQGPADLRAPIGSFVNFDVPGAVNGTSPVAISQNGAIAGTWADANSMPHGFWRSSRGGIVTFDAPGAVNGTAVGGLAPNGAITGTYFDANFIGRGFVRASNGSFAVFDAPGALLGSFGTQPTGINPAGTVTGFYFDANFVAHSFVRASNGAITVFDAPGSGSPGLRFPEGTLASTIDSQGNIVGIYSDASGAYHGFIRDKGGHFTAFAPPGRIDAVFVPFALGSALYVSPQGTIVGTYFAAISGNPFGGDFRVFIRAADGTYTTFDAANYPPCCIWSFPSGIAPNGEIVGSFNDGHTINHGFLRAADGTVATFDAPGAGTGFNQGTAALGITPSGTVVGITIDQNSVRHGFLLFPRH